LALLHINYSQSCTDERDAIKNRISEQEIYFDAIRKMSIKHGANPNCQLDCSGKYLIFYE